MVLEKDAKSGDTVTRVCDDCGKVDNLELALDISNGVCLCHSCHSLFHKNYGKKFNTKEQYIQFKEDYNGNKK